ncbi:hypothetical protein [Alkalicoccobacillus plakortidis]|uniref:Uncharacterized protein n=1 Tax=Alkalicoccobacillus plakortidis TaxID=444060 RepID=A0ABT0XJ72_9BACI|nr:hypothetical protein [Alkalicoccobacillus plakortidis]MCM2675941.1 hypothetical protein [Alkalicoccobacillus plakortidis]
MLLLALGAEGNFLLSFFCLLVLWVASCFLLLPLVGGFLLFFFCLLVLWVLLAFLLLPLGAEGMFLGFFFWLLVLRLDSWLSSSTSWC